MRYVVTGGHGFVGANVSRALAVRGDDVVIVEARSDKPPHGLVENLSIPVIEHEHVRDYLERDKGQIGCIVHLGAISDTRCRDIHRLADMNIASSLFLWRWCEENGVKFIYASSAATYGDGSAGFLDRSDASYLSRLLPRNDYARSKHAVDGIIWTSPEERGPARTVGLKFFNIYGPGEDHKGPQASMVLQAFNQLSSTGSVNLFKLGADESPPCRDFVWIGDCVKAVLWLCDQQEVTGLFNLGSGQSRTFEEAAGCVANALGMQATTCYKSMPQYLRDSYQYLTLSENQKLTRAGFDPGRTSLELGSSKYVEWLLSRQAHAC